MCRKHDVFHENIAANTTESDRREILSVFCIADHGLIRKAGTAGLFGRQINAFTIALIDDVTAASPFPAVHGDVVQGNVDAGKNCEIGGNVGGNVSAGKDVTVSGSVRQDVFAGVMVKVKSVSGRIVSGVTSFIGKGKTQQ